MVMAIDIDVKVLGYKGIALGVTADGYLQTNIFDTPDSPVKTFFIGKVKVQAFIDYVKANGSSQTNSKPC